MKLTLIIILFIFSLVGYSQVNPDKLNLMKGANFFSPNSDGYNDTWSISNAALYPKSKIKVYSRWGTLVFNSKNGYNKPWNGKSFGLPVPIGVYYYVIEHAPDNKQTVTGSVTILK